MIHAIQLKYFVKVRIFNGVKIFFLLPQSKFE